MTGRVFLSYIYERGRDYYRKKRVINVSNSGNIFHAQVRGSDVYDVSIAFDANGADVVWMECDCPYAQDGSHCKHEAALYIYIKENGLNKKQKISNEKTIVNKYNLYSSMHYSDYYVFDALLREVNLRLNKIGIIKTYHNDRVKPVFDVIEEVLSLGIDGYYKQQLMDNIINRIYIWRENKQYVNDVIEICKKEIVLQKYSEYIDIMIYFSRYQKNNNEIMNILINMLTKSRFNDDYIWKLMVILYEFVSDSDVKFVLNKLKRFERYHSYSYFYLRQLYIEGKDAQAETFIKNAKIYVPELSNLLMLKEKVDYILKDKEEYKKFIYKYFQDESKRKDIHYIERLKEICGNGWDEDKYDFYDQLFKEMKVNEQKWIINNLKEYDYASKLILDDQSLTVFNRYAPMIKKNDIHLYRYLYLTVLKNELLCGRLYMTSDLRKSLDDIGNTKPSKEEMLEIILSLEDILKFDSSMFDILEQYLKEKGFDDYVEIFEC